MTTVYGIKNCDTMKKAFNWLEKNDVEYTFHDYKKAGIDSKTIYGWLEKFTLDQIINKKGTTWKNLSEKDKKNAQETNLAVQLIIDNPSMIKRPLLHSGKVYLLGFNEKDWENELK